MISEKVGFGVFDQGLFLGWGGDLKDHDHIFQISHAHFFRGGTFLNIKIKGNF